MNIKNPCIITARLLPGVAIGEDSYVSIEYAGWTHEGRRKYRIFIDTPTFEYSDEELASGVGGGTLREGLESACSFLGACGGSVNYTRRTGRKGENADLYPEHVAAWAAENEDDLSVAQVLLDETKDAIEE